MEKSDAMEIIKAALLLEMKGRAFYEHNSRQAGNPGLRKVFETMAVEEAGHIDILSRQLKSLAKSGVFEPFKGLGKPSDFTDQVITGEIRRQTAAAGYEAAAISAAMALEEWAVNFYQDRASTTTNVLEKEIFQWLADWEKSHLNLLSTLDRELMESIWMDNQFWPIV